jgi:hypothetical protein
MLNDTGHTARIAAPATRCAVANTIVVRTPALAEYAGNPAPT